MLTLNLPCKCAAPDNSQHYIDFRLTFFAELCFEYVSKNLKNRDVDANLSGDGTEEGREGEG